MFPTDSNDSQQMLPTDSNDSHGMFPTDSNDSQRILPTDLNDSHGMLRTDLNDSHGMLPTDSNYSHEILPADLNDSILAGFSISFDPAPRRYSSADAMEATSSGKIGASTLPIGAGIGGLLLALIAGSTMFLLLRKKRGDVEISADTLDKEVPEVFDDEVVEGFDTMTSMESLDHCVTVENPDQARSRQSNCLSAFSRKEYQLRSHMAE
jgi:hypothetical protein